MIATATINNASVGTAGVGSMNIYTDMTTGERIAALRRQKGLTQEQFARQLNIHPISMSFVENDRRPPGRPLLQRIARRLDTTVGFLEREHDNPAPLNVADAPTVYISTEAHQAARLIDDVPEHERVRMLAVLRALAETANPAAVEDDEETDAPDELGERRLVLGKHLAKKRKTSGA